MCGNFARNQINWKTFAQSRARTSADGFHVIGFCFHLSIRCHRRFVFFRFSRVSLVIDRNVCPTHHKTSAVSVVVAIVLLNYSIDTYVIQFGRVFASHIVRGTPYRPGLLVSPVAPILGNEQYDPCISQGM